ncbi:hypothetical protein [Labrys monachus]|uniref:Secreted protein n=1 Tax=Labrys monachus TaxID=217067 RepID=A0ABU0FE52_9HYPH|nr:hypothetical protein [Labrys monachus]MDQ0392888.1 hypothetical protein [Labrys monachus]
MMGIRLLTSLAAVALIAKLVDDNRRLRQELDYRKAREQALDLAIIRAAGANTRDVPQVDDREVDETLEDSFPASDPPSFNTRY